MDYFGKAVVLCFESVPLAFVFVCPFVFNLLDHMTVVKYIVVFEEKPEHEKHVVALEDFIFPSDL